MADWSDFLSTLFQNNPGMFGGLGGAPSGGVLGSMGATPQQPQGILSGAMPTPSNQAQNPQSLLGPLGVQPQTISPAFADRTAMSGMPAMDLSAPGFQPPSLQGQNAAPPADDSGSFWSRNNPDGTQDILGGLLKYDPTKDMSRNNRMGLFGATLADMGANIGGHPEAAKNLALFNENQKKLNGQKALADMLTGLGGPAPAAPVPMQPPPRLADNAAAQLPQLPPGGNGTPQSPASMGGAPAVQQSNAAQTGNATGLPQLPPPQSGSQFNLRTLGPKLAALAATGVDISPVVSILKDMQPKFSTDVHWTQDGKPYLASDTGQVQWLDPSVTPRDKMEIAGNGQAYNPYGIQPGADYSDRSKPFDSANGAPNKPVQDYEIRKATAGAQLRLAAQQNVDPKAVQVGVDYAMANGGKLPPTARSPTLQQAIMAGVGDRLQATGQTYDDLVNKGIGIHARGAAASSLARQQGGTQVNEDTVNGGINILNDLIKKGAASKGQFTDLNDLSQYVARHTSDNDAINLKNAVGTISNEYARVMTGQTNGSASSDSARHEAASRLLTGYNGGTMQSVTAQMQNEMRQRSAAYASGLNQTTGGQYSGTQSRFTPTSSLPRKSAPSGVSGGVKWKIVSPGGQ